MKTKIFLSLLLFLCLLLASCRESATPVHEGPKIIVANAQSYQGLQQTFNHHNYQLDQIDAGVPPLILERMPGDLVNIAEVETRKQIFFKIILPLILLVNEEILSEREQLLAIQQELIDSGTLNAQHTQALEHLAARYRVDLETEELSQALELLLRRVNIIPVELALAQAANESAWGTSRFTLVANNLFGQWTFTPGQGIVPEGRPEGQTYEVRKFRTLYDSVRSYANNLNSHHAYKPFRILRAEQQSEAGLDGILLAEGLLRYSIRGEDYVREIQAMIRQNSLQQLSEISLREME